MSYYYSGNLYSSNISLSGITISYNSSSLFGGIGGANDGLSFYSLKSLNEPTPSTNPLILITFFFFISLDFSNIELFITIGGKPDRLFLIYS